MCLEHPEKELGRRPKLQQGRMTLINGFQDAAVMGINAVAFEQELILLCDFLQTDGNRSLHFFPIARFPAAQGEEQHGTLPHLRHHGRIVRDSEAVK